MVSKSWRIIDWRLLCLHVVSQGETTSHFEASKQLWMIIISTRGEYNSNYFQIDECPIRLNVSDVLLMYWQWQQFSLSCYIIITLISYTQGWFRQFICMILHFITSIAPHRSESLHAHKLWCQCVINWRSHYYNTAPTLEHINNTHPNGPGAFWSILNQNRNAQGP